MTEHLPENAVSDSIGRAGVIPIQQGVKRYPLSRWQKGLALLMASKPQMGSQHLVCSAEVTVTDPAFSENLVGWLQSAVLRYPILRAGVSLKTLRLEKVVHACPPVDIRWRNVENFSDDALRAVAREDCRIPFDSETGALWRIHLYRRDENTVVVCLVLHHVMFDFWALGLLLSNMMSALGVASIAETKIDGLSYLDMLDVGTHAFIGFGNNMDAHPRQALMAFWSKCLDGAPVLHSIPTDFARQPSVQEPGSAVIFSLAANTSDAARQFARTLGVTPFFLFLGLWAAFLQRLCGQTDWVIACPASQRATLKEREQLGQFVNILPFRVGVDSKLNLSELITAIKPRLIEVLRHQDVTIHELVELVAPPRSALHAPLAQIGFSWERIPLMERFEDFFLPGQHEAVLVGDGFVARPFYVPQQEGQFELSLEMGGQNKAGELIGQIKYRSDLFSHQRIAQWTDGFAEFVRGALENPTMALEQIPLADESTAKAWASLGQGKLIPVDIPSVCESICGHALKQPDAMAIVDSEESYSYKTSVQLIHALAVQLAAQGVVGGDHVGVCLPRGANWPIAVLAIWRLGAVYVPLDDSFPDQRLAWMIEDAKLKLAIVDEANETRLAALYGALPTVGIQSILADVSATDESALTSDVLASSVKLNPHDAAYLLYTSGSTGHPKGVRVGHGALANLLQSLMQRIGFDEHGSWLSVTTPAFDISILEMLMPLITGASVYIANRTEVADPIRLAELIDGLDIQVMQATPTHWRMLIESGWQGATNLTVLCGGEPLSAGLAEQLINRVGQLWNVYGPTETTIWSSATQLINNKVVHLGEPLNNTDFLVLDANRKLLPPGCIGELWIAGQGLAIDYWQRPDLTEHSFAVIEGLEHFGRCYKTGDRVRWNMNGQLECLGRLDSQVKFNGHRIELAEIESVVQKVPGVEMAVAILLSEEEAEASQARLVCFVQGEPSHNWRDTLRETLPGYMIPSALIAIDQWPLTSNGKLDRKRLAQRVREGGIRVDIGAATQQPRSAEELVISAAFADVLGVATVPMNESFFDLGGHSLQAVQLIALLNRRFDLSWQSSVLLESPTVERMATRLLDHRKRIATGPAEGSAVVMNGGSAGIRPLWLFHPIGGTVFCYSALVRQLDPRRPIRAFEAPSLQDSLLAEVSVEALAKNYAEQIVELQPQGPYLLGGWCFGGVIAYEVAKQLTEAGHPIDAVILIDTRAPVLANHPTAVDDMKLLDWFVQDLARPHGKRFDMAGIEGLKPKEAMEAVHRQAANMSLISADTDVSAIERSFNAFLAHGIALQTYLPQFDSALGFQLLLILAQDEPTNFGKFLGWDELVEPFSMQVKNCPGDHYTVMIAPNVTEVADIIEDLLPVQDVPDLMLFSAKSDPL